jgi:CheY-like chemotaxis protein/nitrogen-specific signal transduction histidine kinase
MVWTGYSVGALLERTRQQNRLLTERSEDLAKARDAAEAASAEKATLLANMSHEIRTPMTSVLGLSELLLREDLAPASLEHVEQIRLSACSLVAIINDILDFSKLEAGRVSLKLSPVELRVVVTRTLAGLTVEAREQGLCIPVEVSSEVPAWVELDALRFGQVLLNLVGNAVKFTDEGSVRVSVTAAPRGDGLALQLVVADTGVGISAEDQAQIFEQFSQGAAGSQRDTGTGLGLTITRQLVDLMGGEILLESDVGRGAKFSVELPTRSVDAPAAALESEPEHEVDAALSVLVVEDNEMNRKILAKMLRLLGVAPSVACDGREALEAVRAGNFDLVLMDCRMPVMDGLQATRAIRAAETPGSVGPRIIALTGNASEEDAALCREAGMDGLMAKPVALGQLREVLSETEVADRSGPA